MGRHRRRSPSSSCSSSSSSERSSDDRRRRRRRSPPSSRRDGQRGRDDSSKRVRSSLTDTRGAERAASSSSEGRGSRGRRRERATESRERGAASGGRRTTNNGGAEGGRGGDGRGDHDEDLKEYIAKKFSKMEALEGMGRSGGVYVPPFKLQRAVAADKGSELYQRQMWEALRKSLNGLVNKVNVNNIGDLVQELFRENLVRGRGLFCRAIIRAQMASPGFTHIYAALLAIVNSKLPEIGELVLKRVILQFRRAYRLKNKIVCTACVKFLAHLVNQRVAHELLALELCLLLLEEVTDDSVSVCIEFLQECGEVLRRESPQGFNAVLDRLRGILHEGQTDKRVQYTIEKLFDIVRTKFKDYPGVVPELDLVEEDDQITHEMHLDDPEIKGEEILNIFQAKDPEEYKTEEAKWEEISREILGEEDAAADGEGESSADSEAEEEQDELVAEGGGDIDRNAQQKIVDYTEQEMTNLRKFIYLCIVSSAGFEECVHKLLKLNVKEGAEIEICTMLIDCCSMERTLQMFFPLCAERLCRVKEIYKEGFMDCFAKQYRTVHRLETNKLRNIASLFAHLLYTDALPWTVLEIIELTESTTTSASRIFIKTVLLELSRNMGFEKLQKRLNDPTLAPHLQGLFPTDHPKNIRFAINFYPAIGLGGLSDGLRKILADAQSRSQAAAAAAAESDSSSSDESD